MAEVDGEDIVSGQTDKDVAIIAIVSKIHFLNWSIL
jgi:hypothetical protein